MSYTVSRYPETVELRTALMQLGKQLLEEGRLLDAWKVLLLAE